MTEERSHHAVAQSRTRWVEGRLSVADAARGRRRPQTCSACLEPGHTRRTCSLAGLALWTNGSDVLVARDGADASKLQIEMVSTFVDRDLQSAELFTMPDEWKRLECDTTGRFTFSGKTASSVTWIKVTGGRGLLATDGELAPGRKVA